jgi:hypothetical protein
MSQMHHDPHAPVGELVLLRRRDGGDDVVFEHPVMIVGHVMHLDFDTVTISGGRGSFTELYLEDLYDLLDGPDMTMNIFLDAAEHNDEVHIKLAPEGLSYVNAAQHARLEQAVAQP